MPKLTVNGLETYYELDDFTDPWREDIETIVIQQGTGRNSRFWRHWVPALAREYRVIRRDLRGFGRSGDPGPDYVWRMEDLLDDLKGFLEALEIGRIHFLGESVGGVIGVAFATKWPEYFRTLTLCSTPSTLRKVQGILSLGQTSRSEVVQNLGLEGMVKALINRGAISGGSPERTEWVIREWTRTPSHVMQNIGALNMSFDVTSSLPRITVPTLILAPGNSPIKPLQDQIDMHRLIPNSRLVVVDDFGDEIYVENAPKCIEAFRNFVQSNPERIRR